MPKQTSNSKTKKKLHLREKILTAEGWRRRMAEQYPEKFKKKDTLSVKKKPGKKKAK